MKITKLTTYLVPPRWCFLKMETDEGIVGWGEPVLEGRAATVATAVEELSDYLVGKDPFRIEDHWTVMYRGGFYRGGGVLMSAIAGIDQALWDIKGKAFGVPVHQLLGGRLRDTIRVYSWIGGDRPADTAEAAREVAGRGFTAVKMNATEELQYIDSHASTPIALGERLFSRWDFKRILAEGYVDIVQPDPSHAGGITETRKIAAMAEAYDVALALHCPLGPIALAANLQIDAVCHNAFIQEQSLGIHYNKTNDLLDYLKNPKVFDYRDGVVVIPEAPGLGIEINEEVVLRQAKIGHRWRNPVWRHHDGTFAEW